LKLKKDPQCPVCSANPTVTQLINYEAFCGLGRGAQSEAAQTNGISEISVEELKDKLEKKQEFLLLDVRENFEYEIAKIEGSRLIPLGQLEGQLKDLESFKGKEIVAHCHHGGRSRKALEILQSKGFSNLKNVEGGIDAWSLYVDSSVPRY